MKLDLGAQLSLLLLLLFHNGRGKQQFIYLSEARTLILAPQVPLRSGCKQRRSRAMLSRGESWPLEVC